MQDAAHHNNYIYTDTHTHTYIHTYAHTYMIVYACIHTYTCLHIHTYISTYIHACIHTYNIYHRIHTRYDFCQVSKQVFSFFQLFSKYFFVATTTPRGIKEHRGASLSIFFHRFQLWYLPPQMGRSATPNPRSELWSRLGAARLGLQKRVRRVPFAIFRAFRSLRNRAPDKGIRHFAL